MTFNDLSRLEARIPLVFQVKIFISHESSYLPRTFHRKTVEVCLTRARLTVPLVSGI